MIALVVSLLMLFISILLVVTSEGLGLTIYGIFVIVSLWLVIKAWDGRNGGAL